MRLLFVCNVVRAICVFAIANVYGLGDSERVIGRWMATKARDSLVIATKVIRIPCHDNMQLFLLFLGLLIPCAFVLCFVVVLCCHALEAASDARCDVQEPYPALAGACLSLLATQPLCGVTRVMIAFAGGWTNGYVAAAGATD